MTRQTDQQCSKKRSAFFVQRFGNDPEGNVAVFADDAIAVGEGSDEVSFGIDRPRSIGQRYPNRAS